MRLPNGSGAYDSLPTPGIPKPSSSFKNANFSTDNAGNGSSKPAPADPLQQVLAASADSPAGAGDTAPADSSAQEDRAPQSVRPSFKASSRNLSKSRVSFKEPGSGGGGAAPIAEETDGAA